MMYKNIRISFEDMKNMVHASQDAQSKLITKLLLGVKPPPAGKLVDDVNYRAAGYNFAQPLPGRSHAPHVARSDDQSKQIFPDDLVLLHSGVFKSETVFLQFFSVDKAGKPHLRQGQAMEYLMDYSSLQKEVMSTVQVTTCGPARGTELTAMQVKRSTGVIRQQQLTTFLTFPVHRHIGCSAQRLRPGRLHVSFSSI